MCMDLDRMHVNCYVEEVKIRYVVSICGTASYIDPLYLAIHIKRSVQLKYSCIRNYLKFLSRTFSLHYQIVFIPM